MPQDSLPRNCAHLRRVSSGKVLDTTTANDQELKSLNVLLPAATILGREHGNNHVVLTCNHPRGETQNFIKGRHAFIRAKMDKTGESVLFYEIAAYPGAQLTVNGHKITQYTRLHYNDLIALGNGTALSHICFQFRFEPADPHLTYPVIKSNLRREPQDMKSLVLSENSSHHRAGSISNILELDPLLLAANKMSYNFTFNKPEVEQVTDENARPQSTAAPSELRPVFAEAAPPPQPVDLEASQHLIHSLAAELLQRHYADFLTIVETQGALDAPHQSFLRECLRTQQINTISKLVNPQVTPPMGLFIVPPPIAAGGPGAGPFSDGPFAMPPAHQPSPIQPLQAPMLFVEHALQAQTPNQFVATPSHLSASATASAASTSNGPSHSSLASGRDSELAFGFTGGEGTARLPDGNAACARSHLIKNDDRWNNRNVAKDGNPVEDEQEILKRNYETHMESSSSVSRVREQRSVNLPVRKLVMERDSTVQEPRGGDVPDDQNVSADFAFAQNRMSFDDASTAASSPMEVVSLSINSAQPTTNSATHGRVRSKPVASMADSEDEDAVPKSIHGMEAVRRRTLKFIAHNRNTFYHTLKYTHDDFGTKPAGVNWTSDMSCLRVEDPFKRCERVAKDRVVLKPLGKLPNGPKSQIVIDEGAYEQSCALDLRKRVMEQRDLNESYPALDYPTVPKLTVEERELRLHAVLFQSIPNNMHTPNSVEENSPEPVSVSEHNRYIDLDYQRLEKELPSVPGLGRQTTSKYRAMYRGGVDVSAAKNMPIQKRRLEEKHLVDQQKLDESTKKKLSKTKKPVVSTHSGTRKGRGSLGKKTQSSLPVSPVAPTVVPHANAAIQQGAKGNRRPAVSVGVAASHKPRPSNVAELTTFWREPPSGIPKTSFAREPPGAELMRRSTVNNSIDPISKHQEGLPRSPDSKYYYETKSDVKTPLQVKNDQNRTKQVLETQRKRKYGKRKYSGSGQEEEQAVATSPQRKTTRKSNGQRERKMSKREAAELTARNQRRVEDAFGMNEREPQQPAVSNTTSEADEPCSSLRCTLREAMARNQTINWVACDVCDKWFHCYCAIGEDRPVGSTEVFRCRQPDCSSCFTPADSQRGRR